MDRSTKKNVNGRRWVSSAFRIVALYWLCLLVSTRTIVKCQAQQQESNGENAYLTEDSVVLITGAAGFLGSELALALHRTYSPKLIICVDRMGDRPDSQEELALFEFQRQRSFNVMQTLGEKGRFYRVDFSPMIPEYFDLGEVPVLDHIFREHPDISHVVHLADPFPHSALQAVPREKDVPKAGMMEALLEQLAKHERDINTKRDNQDKSDSNTNHKLGYSRPNFVYASSFEVYPHYTLSKNLENRSSRARQQINSLEEKQTLTTPSSLRGASKMMDEMIAKLYYDTKGIYSVGLRFFNVYGPWGVPGSPLFEMAERAVAGVLDGLDEQHEITNFYSGLNSDDWKKTVHDFVYIDDAVDALMAAMQFRSSNGNHETSTSTEQYKAPHPIIFNVASGEGHSMEDILGVMEEFFPPKDKKYSKPTLASDPNNRIDPTGSIGSTKRAASLLGYQPQVSLREGIIKMLAWHYDRAFPYGGDGPTTKDQINENADGSEKRKIHFVAQQGIAGCLQYDKECLRGTPIFPCASECSHKAQCTKSYYDEVIAQTQKLASKCKSVMYTIDLDDSLVSLPSADPKFESSKSFLEGACNLAFVSQQSPLVKERQHSSEIKGDGVLRNGPWVLIPLTVVPFSKSSGGNKGVTNDVNEFLKLLPKLSPGIFFGSKTTERAVYIDPDIVIDNISKLLLESYAQPYHKEMESATAMLIGRGTPKDYFSDDGDDEEIILKLDNPNYKHQKFASTNTLVQNAAYRMVKIAVSDSLFGDGFVELLDSRWIVHGLQSDDGRLFRCDVLGEVVQWEVTSDKSALEFVLGLHDMWSRVIAKSSGVGSWWIGDNVVTVAEGKQQGQAFGRRRLLEDEEVGSVNSEVDAAVTDRENEAANENSETVDLSSDSKASPPEGNVEVGMTVENGEGEVDADVEREEPADEGAEDDDFEEKPPEDSSGEGEEMDRGEFVADAVAQKEVKTDEEQRGDSSDERQEDSRPADENEKVDKNDEEDSQMRDFSSYDTWMGILSSSNIKYFVRIVPSLEVGVVSIDRT